MPVSFRFELSDVLILFLVGEDKCDRKILPGHLKSRPSRGVLCIVPLGGLGGDSNYMSSHISAKSLGRRGVLRLQADAPVENRGQGLGIRG